MFWAFLFSSSFSYADLFEIQVYEYETVDPGKWELETHLNNIARGTKDDEPPVSRTNGQFHLSFELTRGLSENFELAGYLLQAYRPGVGVEYAGTRIRPRVKAPQKWALPVDLALAAEVGFPQPRYERNPEDVEIRPIIGKTLGMFRLVANPVIGKVLNGPDANQGFEFEPGAKLSYLDSRLPVTPNLEYYGSLGPFRRFNAEREQQHFLYPCIDFVPNQSLDINLGVGFGLTPTSEKLIFKTIIGYGF